MSIRTVFNRRNWLLAITLAWSCQSATESIQATKKTNTNDLIAVDNTPNDLRIGLLAPFSGPFASSGLEIRTGIAAYLQLHGDTVAGRKIVLLERDTTGVAPDVAKRLAQELVTNDHVDFLAGFALTPNAMAVASVATKSKTPMVVMNAATSSITTKSPYIVRLSFTVSQAAASMAQWAIKNDIKSVYTLVSDYAPGADAEAQFAKTFSAAGGKIIASVRVPLRSPDFAPYVQKLKDAKPQAVFVFVPSGAQGIALMKTFKERGISKTGIRIIATGSVTEDYQLPAMGEQALGVVSAHHYSLAHKSPENDAFKKAFNAVNKDDSKRANFMAVGGYDGMAAMAAATKALNGKFTGAQAMEQLKNFETQSPRGPIHIDPKTRDIVQTVYVRRVEKQGDSYYNVEFDQFLAVADPAK